MKKLPKGWSWEGTSAVTLHAGRRYDLLSCGKKVVVGWTLTVHITATAQGIEIDVDDDDRQYTSGAYTSASIPWEVLDALRESLT